MSKEPVKWIIWLKPLLPLWGDIKYLILGSFPGIETLKVNIKNREQLAKEWIKDFDKKIRQKWEYREKPIYYCSLKNCFWKIMKESFPKSKSLIDNIIEKIKNKEWDRVAELQQEFCDTNMVGLWDKVSSCVWASKTSSNTIRKVWEYNDIFAFLIKYSDCKIISNWSFGEYWTMDYIKCHIFPLNSTSWRSWNRENTINEWKAFF